MRQSFTLVFAVLVAVACGLHLAEDCLQQRLIRHNEGCGEWLQTADGNRLFVRYKPAFQGPLFILETGLNGDSWQVEDLATSLAGYGSVLSFDRRGLGLSSGGGLSPDLDRAAADTAALLDRYAMGRPVVFIGYSLGGTYALNFHRKYPRQLAALVLIDPPSPREQELPPAIIDSWLGSYDRYLKRMAGLAVFGLPRLSAIARGLKAGTHDWRGEQLLSRGHLATAYLEGLQLYSYIVAGTDYFSPLGDLPFLVLTATQPRGVDTNFCQILLADLARIGRRGQQLTFSTFEHQNFLEKPLVQQTTAGIVSYLMEVGMLPEEVAPPTAGLGSTHLTPG